MPLLHTTVATSGLTFQGTYLDENDLTVYTFPDVPIGDPSPDRVIVVAAYTEAKTPVTEHIIVSGISIDTTEADWLSYNDSSYSTREVWGQRFGSGTTADITVETSLEAKFCEIAVFSLYNMAFDLATDYFYSSIDFLTPVTSTSFTCKIFEGGAYIFCCPGLRTFTGFDANFTGTYISGGYLLAQQYEAARAFTASSALPTDGFGYKYGTNVSFGP